MSLKLWLPLNGSLKNNGISDAIITASGAAVNASGKIGQCYSFDGSDDYISINCPDLYQVFTGGTQPFSICFWIYHADATRAIIFGDYGLSGTISFNLELTTAHCVRFYWNSSPDKVFAAATAVAASGWTHIVLTYDGTKMNIYKNGVLQTDSWSGTLATKAKTSGVFYLGRDSRTGTTVLNGRLNDFRIYDHCLSVKEVEEIAKGLVLHYKLNKANNNLAFNVLDLSKWSKESGVTAAWDDTVQMFKVQDTSHTSSRWGIYQQIDCLPDTTYTFSVDGMKVNNTSYIAAGSSVSGAWPSNGSAFTTTRTRLSMTFTTGSDHTKIRMYLSLYPTDGGTNYTYFANPKLEFGSEATDFISENFNTNIIEDNSGYENNGWLIDGQGINDSPRYKTSLYLKGATVDSSSNTITGAQYFYGNLSLSASSALTVAWWGNNIAYGRGGIFETTAQIFNATNGYQGTDYNTTAIANWDSTFGIYNGSTRINIFSSFIKDSTWHYHTIVFDAAKVYYYCDGNLITSSTLTGTLPAFNGIRMGLGRAGGIYRQIEQKVSDLRIYITALTINQIKELYNTSATIDKAGNVYAREVIE